MGAAEAGADRKSAVALAARARIAGVFQVMNVSVRLGAWNMSFSGMSP